MSSTINNLTLRSPIDYTENVVLATLGSNWKAPLSSFVRTLLTADTNYYVATTGSDSNPGTALLPWATLQHAALFVAANLDIAGFAITVNIGAGSFVGFGTASFVGGGIISFVGAGPASTTITAGPSDGIFNFGECIDVAQLTSTTIQTDEVTIAPSTSHGIVVYSPGISFNVAAGGGGAVTFDATGLASANLMFCDTPGSLLQTSAAITIIGGSGTGVAFLATLGGVIFFNATTAVSGTFTNSPAFAVASEGGIINNQSSITGGGSVTGPRFSVSAAIIDIGGQGQNFFPGNAAGTIDNGGIYK